MLRTIFFIAFVANVVLIGSATECKACGKLEVPDPCANGGCYKKRKCSDILHGEICVDPIKCIPGCLCKKGYLRNNGTCIPRDQCPQKLKCPGQYEVYNDCLDTCDPNTCESIGKQYNCPLQSANKKCTGGCVCEPGYYRNKNGQCTSEENCKKCTGPNEYYACGGACDNICETLAERNQTHCDIINIKCNEMCYCIKGYARLKNGTCVPFDQCPVQTKCGKNEMLIKCPALYCGPRTCDQKDTKPLCLHISPGLPCPGSPGCVCKSGYLRDTYSGKCIPEAQCPPKCGINEIYSNCINGGCFGTKTCEEVGKVPIKCVKIDPKYCIKGCKCIDGYVKSKNGTCIAADKCPTEDKPPKCGKLEVPDSCANGGCYKERKCSDILHGIICVDPIKCISGCLCKKGYLRYNGKCIAREQCPQKLKCPGQYEVYNDCLDTCDPNTCESIGKQYNCPLQSANKKCTGGCVCEPGYYRNKNGQCTSEENCKKCTGPNEYYACGGACDNICETLAERNQTHCDIINIKCNEMCYCIEGYARLKNGTCVPFDQCPVQTPKCGKFEVADDCINGGCYAERSCDDIGSSYKCLRPKICKKGCLCKPGYLKNSKGECILRKKCPNYRECYEKDSEEKNCSKDKNRSKDEDSSTDSHSDGSCETKNHDESDDNDDEIENDDNSNDQESYENDSLEKNNSMDKNRSEDENNSTDSKSDGSCKSENHDESDDNDDEIKKDDNKNGTHDGTSECNNTDSYIQFSQGITEFSSQFVKEAAKIKKNENCVMSPFSVLVILAELALFTTGRSFDQLINAMGLQNKCQIEPVFTNFSKGIKDLQNITLDLAARTYFNEKYPVTEAFLENTDKVFGAAAEAIDVNQPQKSADAINRWVEAQTNSLIKNLVNSDMITTDTRLVLVNAIYFKGYWKYPFDSEKTSKLDFYVTADNVQQIDTMFIETRVEYALSADLDAKLIRLPYKNEKFSAVFILPNKKDGVDALLDKIQDTNKYKAALESMRVNKVKIWLPKYKIVTTFDLAEILQKLGITDIFTDQSGLSGMLKSGEQTKVSEAVHKCVIEVSEEGTEAAAANAIGISVTSVQLDPPEFKADHPFVFALYYESYILFIGVQRNPSFV